MMRRSTSAHLAWVLTAIVTVGDRAVAQGGPTITSVSPPAGPTAGGDGVTIFGSGFVSGATVTIGGAAATNVIVVEAGTITATTPAHAAGTASVVVTNPGGTSGTLSSGYQFLIVAPFADDPLQAGVTAMAAQHLVELRQAVDNVRQAAGLSAAAWTDPTVTPGSTVIRASHLLELRARFDEALTALGYAVGSYTDPSLPADAVAIKALHLQELRDRLRRIPPFCTYTLAPRSTTPSGASAAGTVSVATGAACDWLAAAVDSWVSLTTTPSGVGSGSVSFVVQANPTASSRATSIRIAGQSFPVSQAPCTIALAPTSASLSALGGTPSVDVLEQGSCSWTATANVPWIIFLDPISGTGPTSIQYRVDANATTSPRTGQITLAGQSLTVSQTAGASSVIITRPESPATYGQGDTVTLTAAVDAASGTPDRIDYVDGGGAVVASATSAASAFAAQWSGGAVGSYDIAAVAVYGAVPMASSAPVTVEITGCAPIDPTDWVADDLGLQCRLDRGGTIELVPGDPGYLVNGITDHTGRPNGRGLYITRDGTHLTSSQRALDIRATIIGGKLLDGAILETCRGEDPVCQGAGSYTGIEIDHLSFDGWVDEFDSPEYPGYVAGRPWRAHRDECEGDVHAPGNLALTAPGLSFHDNESLHALCGSGLGLVGSVYVYNNYVAFNGRDRFSGGGGAPWSDGLTLVRCDPGGYLAWNTLVDNTDIDFVVGGANDCTVELNTIAHFGKYAYMGLNIGQFNTNVIGGNHAGSIYRDNRVYTGKVGNVEPQPGDTPNDGVLLNRLSIGIAIGGHPFRTTAQVTHAGAVQGNTSHHNVMNLVIDGVCPKGHLIVNEACTPDPSLTEVERAQLPPNGDVSGNVVYDSFGNQGLGSFAPNICPLSLDYAVNPHHKGDLNAANNSVPQTELMYDNGGCGSP